MAALQTGPIRALATGADAGNRAIVRVSGPSLEAPFARLGLSFPKHRERRIEPISLWRGVPPLPVELWCFPGPRSFTGEDLAEFHLVGGGPWVSALLRRLDAVGVSPAGPGDFTRRAFLSGRMALGEAEAVAALLAAKDRHESRAALATLGGGLTDRVAAMEARVVALLARLELALDFSDQDIEIPPPPEAEEQLRKDAAALSAFAEMGVGGALASGAPSVLLHGPPNAGKSTLFNRLQGRAAAIASSEAGTTRDVLSAEIRAPEGPYRLIDTPGYGLETSALDRAAGQQRARWMEGAHLVLEVRHGATLSLETAAEPVSEAAPRPSTERSQLRVATHADRVPAEVRARQPEWCWVDGREAADGGGAGVEQLRKRIAHELRQVSGGTAPYSVSARHGNELRAAAVALEEAAVGLADALPEELLAVPLRAALASLGRATGRSLDDSVLDAVFRDFCIGK